jgi:hypothetical protein
MALLQPQDVYLDGPQPPNGRQFCTLCIMRYKAAVLSSPGVKEQIDRSEAGLGPNRLSMLSMAPGAELPELSVGLNMCPQLGNQILPVCWGHGAGVSFTNLVSAQALPQEPGLNPNGRR